MSLFMDHVVGEKNNAKMLHSKNMVFICLTDTVQYIALFTSLGLVLAPRLGGAW